MGRSRKLEAFSTHRLGGEPVPEDVKILLAHADELAERTGIELNWKKGWAPWLDTSYLTEAERANPDIAANVRAIAGVCGLIAFVAAHEDGEYFGYWRGPGKRAVADSPIVRLDNEGQFNFCGGSSFAEALLSEAVDDDQFDEWRSWLESLGITVRPASLAALKYPKEKTSPDKLHKELYRRYLG
ncbi:MAG: hypothetical protein L0Z62_46025 [Gemmataceae bacterium]|nr:hypothetical protein [Gemmataceae bacterium]